jgi:site-specific DNA-methyltransferase (adenine-specific)
MTKELLGGLELNRIYQRDCLEGSSLIENESVDLILTDLPYGNMNTDGGRKLGINGWDFAIDPLKIHEIANRILRKNGKMVLFSQEPYTTELIKSAIPNIPFSYRAIWEKDNFANALGVNKAMVSFYEDILIFSKSSEATPPHDFEGIHPLRPHFKAVLEFIGLPKKKIIETVGQRADHTFRIDSTQYSLCTEQTYDELIRAFGIDKMGGFKEYEELKNIDMAFKKSKEAERLEYLARHNEKYPSTFNLWNGAKYKANILKYKKDYDGFHPTQKPVLLLEDLIKTFSNEDDLVIDLTCGSGSTCVAAVRTGRKFIGFETETKYVEIANKRLDNEEESND